MSATHSVKAAVDTATALSQDEQAALMQVRELLTRQRRVTTLVHRQTRDGSRHQLVEGLVHKQHLSELRSRLAPLGAPAIAALLETLPEDDGLVVWELLANERSEDVLALLSDDLREQFAELMLRQMALSPADDVPVAIHAFVPEHGRLRHVQVRTRDELAALSPAWVDLLAPSAEQKGWIEELYGVRLPDADDLTDLEASARCYVAENGELRLNVDFLLGAGDESRNVMVAFILRDRRLFSVRSVELPVLRVQRLRARIEPGVSTEGADLLLDVLGAEVEHLADVLEGIYGEMEQVGASVVSPQVSDDEAAAILARIAAYEDLNGRIRRNVLDARRALSFLMRGRLLGEDQQRTAGQLLRDIESLNSHTAFLFGKFSFLLDATVGFININQNKRVSRLTVIGVVFTPINIVASVGGMSEFSRFTEGVPWPLAYGGLLLGFVAMGWVTFAVLYLQERARGVMPAVADEGAGGGTSEGPKGGRAPYHQRRLRPHVPER